MRFICFLYVVFLVVIVTKTVNSQNIMPQNTNPIKYELNDITLGTYYHYHINTVTVDMATGIANSAATKTTVEIKITDLTKSSVSVELVPVNGYSNTHTITKNNIAVVGNEATFSLPTDANTYTGIYKIYVDNILQPDKYIVLENIMTGQFPSSSMQYKVYYTQQAFEHFTTFLFIIIGIFHKAKK